MISFFRTIALFVTAFFATLILGTTVIVAALLGVKDKPDGLFDKAPRWWSTIILWATGIKVRVHGLANVQDDEPHIFASNHVSWFDVPALAKILPHYKFVAKAELFKVPIFGHGMRAVGMIEIQRENRKAAFGAYEMAADNIRKGASVDVFPEGTRGRVVVHGTIEIMPKGSLRVHPGTIDVHLLKPVSTTGFDYDHREALMEIVRTRMADTMREFYGIESPPSPPSRLSSSVEVLSTDTLPTETR